MRPRNMDQMAQHILHSIMSPKWGHLNSIMSPKLGHLIIIGTMWLKIITLYSKLWWHFIETVNILYCVLIL